MVDLLDLHTHATASDRVYNFLYEMIHSASARRLSLFRCSDHAPATPGNCHFFHFINFKVLPKTLYSVRLMMDMELSIMDYDGAMDLKRSILEPSDHATASLHQPCIRSGAAPQSTNACLGALRNPLIRIIGYLDNSRFPTDCDTLVVATGECHKPLEVSNSSLNPLGFHMGARNSYIKALELCRHYDTSITINSSAHYEVDAGSHAFAHALLEEVGFPQELIVNTSLDRLYCFLPKAAAILAQREGERCSRLYRSVTTKGGSTPGGSES